MNIRSEIKNGEVNNIIEFIKKNYSELPLVPVSEDPLSLSLKYDSLTISNYLLNGNYHTLCSHDKQVNFLKNAVSGSSIFPLIKLLTDISYTKYELNYVLSRAASYGDVLTVKILLDAGAECSIVNALPLINSIDDGNTSVSIFLIDQLNNIKYVDAKGFTLLHHVAAISLDENLLKYLIYKKLDVNEVNDYGRTPLMLSLLSIELDPESMFFEFGLELIKAGADINIQDNDGNTVLMLACMSNGYLLDGDDDLVKYLKVLIENGADITLSNHQNKTAIDIAKEYQFEEAIMFLENYIKEVLVIPNTEIKESNSANTKTNTYPDSSFLSEKGYKTKLSRSKRWDILINEVLTEYSPQIVINKLSSFIKRFKAQRNGPKKYAEAITEWEYDIQRIHTHFNKNKK